jgi:starch synthase
LKNKLALQHEVGLKEDVEIPLLAMVTRLDYQKGVDLIPEALKILIDSKTISSSIWQLIILGTGDSNIEQMLRKLENEISDQVRVVIRFDSQLSHRIFSGADMNLIPSRFEPCGLTQMIAMRYGCIPVARSTGGLVDTIKDFDAVQDSTGFLFEDSTPVDLARRIGDALRVFEDKKLWKELAIRGMKTDFSWDRSAFRYRKLYSDLISGKK